MRIFVTGGTGFIGTHVVSELGREGNTLLSLSSDSKITNKNIENIINGNLSDINNWRDKVERFQPELGIHMAWEGIPNYDSKISIRNLRYGLDLITMLSELECKRVICTGSCWEYEKQKGKISEDMPLKPLGAFPIAKNSLYELGKEIAKESNMQFIWTRLFYVYGHGQKESSLIPHIINCVRNGKKPDIKTPSVRNDFIHVEDVASAICSISHNCYEECVYNIGSGYSTSVQEITEIICNKFNLKYDENKTNTKNNSIVDFWADISKIKIDCNWEPKISIEEGIFKTIKCAGDLK